MEGLAYSTSHATQTRRC